MQTLYTLATLEADVKPGEPAKLLQKHFDQSKELLTYLIYFITDVASYAETDAYNRSSKHLPSAEDLSVNTKIAGNLLLWKIKEDPYFISQVNKDKPQLRVDRELVRKLYSQIAETPEYKLYIATPERNEEDEKNMMFFIADFMLSSELFISHIEENFINWDDDSDMVVPLLRNYFQKPGTLDFEDFVSKDKLQFAKSLLQTVLEKSEQLEAYIIPKLKNWDAERIAQLDMILMKQGTAEFLFFDTIPPKVTINEYIDLAKDYSTQQSGQFINGILDGINKDLQSGGKMHKTDFRKA